MTSKLKTDVLETGSGSGTIALNNQLSGMTSSSMPSGSVLQVVQGTTSTTVSSTTNTWVDTGLSASITPASSSSKILITFNQQGVGKWTNNTACSLRLLKGSTQLQFTSDHSPYTGSSLEVRGLSVSSSYLDSPSTTSTTTYKTQFRSTNNNATVAVQDPSGTSTITLTEIKG